MDPRAEYLQGMSKMVGWMARRYQTCSPVLGKEDLYQDSMMELLSVYDNPHNAGKPLSELCAIGRKAVVRRIYLQRKREWRPMTNGYITGTVSLDADLDGGGTLAEIIGNQTEDIYFWFAIDELERNLDELARCMLAELLAPSDAMLSAVRTLSKRYNGKAGNWWQKHRVLLLAKIHHRSYSEVSQALARVRKQVSRIFIEQPADLTYREVNGSSGATTTDRPVNTQRMEGSPMKGFVPKGKKTDPSTPKTTEQASGSVDQALAAAESESSPSTPASPEPETASSSPETAKPKAKGKPKAKAETPAQRQAKAKAAQQASQKASQKKAEKKPKAVRVAKDGDRKAFEKAGKVGIIDTIIEMTAPEKGGSTKTAIYEKLAKRFPDHPIKGMRTTVHIYLGGRLERDKGYKIVKKGEGKEAIYTCTPPKSKK